MNKFEESFNKFRSPGTIQETQNLVNKILKDSTIEKDSDTLQKIYSCIDATMLNPATTKKNITKFVNDLEMFHTAHPSYPNVAAICSYSSQVGSIKAVLQDENVKVCSVIGFPTSQTFIEIKIAEASMAIMQGANEIDTVINLGHFFEHSYEELTDELTEIKDCCRDATLKVIIETGAFKTSEEILKAAILAAFSGADFIKTSTGKEFIGATPEAVYIICKVIQQYEELFDKKIGIKISGGISTSDDALIYYKIVEEILGNEWLTPQLFRIGSSKLPGNIQKELTKLIK